MPPSDPEADPSAAPRDPPPRNASIPEVVKAVFSSFLGIRRGQAMRKDAVTIRPHQVIVVAIVLVAIFVVSLIVFVRIIIRAAGA
ncbi:MAG: DUF2970 domain-containing protein [Casimicrobiaceae bacterium]